MTLQNIIPAACNANLLLLLLFLTFLDVQLRYSCLVGATHVDNGGRPDKKRLAGTVEPKFFFAPDWIARRLKDASTVAGRVVELVLTQSGFSVISYTYERLYS